MPGFRWDRALLLILIAVLLLTFVTFFRGVENFEDNGGFIDLGQTLKERLSQ